MNDEDNIIALLNAYREMCMAECVYDQTSWFFWEHFYASLCFSNYVNRNIKIAQYFLLVWYFAIIGHTHTK